MLSTWEVTWCNEERLVFGEQYFPSFSPETFLLYVAIYSVLCQHGYVKGQPSCVDVVSSSELVVRVNKVLLPYNWSSL